MLSISLAHETRLALSRLQHRGADHLEELRRWLSQKTLQDASLAAGAVTAAEVETILNQLRGIDYAIGAIRAVAEEEHARIERAERQA